eukprot:Skav236267  [mRNA]  locus=scaffold2289:27277:29020:- [translate_table: standard]
MFHRLGALHGVSWAIAEEQPIEVILGEVVVPRHHCDTKPQLVHEVPDDVVLDTAVYGQDVNLSLRIVKFIFSRAIDVLLLS